jgi:hypothetical protein
MLRLDIMGFLVTYLDRVRRKKSKVDLIRRIKSYFRETEFTSNEENSAHIKAGPSYFNYIDQLYELQQTAKMPPKEESEPAWMHDYSVKKHEHVNLYSGCVAYNLACTLHTLELPIGGKRFSLKLKGQQAMFRETRNEIPGFKEVASQIEDDDSSDEDMEEVDVGDVQGVAQGVELAMEQIQESHDQENLGGDYEEVQRFAKTFSALFFKNGYDRQLRARRDMFGDMSLSIEVNFAEYGLVRVFFPKPAICNFLSDEQKDRMHELLDYTVDDAQILRDFFRLTERLTDELRSKRVIAGDSMIGKLRFANNELIESMPWWLAIVINFIIIISVRRNAADEIHFEPESFRLGTFSLLLFRV